MPGRLRHLVENLFHRHRVEEDLDEELRSSFEMIAEQFAERGMSPAEARRAARIEFEGLEQVKEKVRDRLAGAALAGGLSDLRFAWRGLRRRPSFAIISVLTLALGIGVNTAVFSVFHAVLLRPPPYRHPEQLALIWGGRIGGAARAVLSGPMLGEIERRSRSLADVAGIWVGNTTLTGGNPEQIKVGQVTSNFFDVLGVPAALGRAFTKEEGNGGSPSMILTSALFRRRFAADAGLLGRGLPTRDGPATLVGVLPADFELQFAPEANVPADVQAFIPFYYDLHESPLTLYFVRVVVRLKPGVSLDEAQRDLDRVAAEMRAAHTPFAAANLQFTITGMHADAVRDIQPALSALVAGAAFVLLICCVNIASLLLARASERRREIALRLTLGASRGRILRQLCAEGGMLCLLGGAAGALVGWAGFRALLLIRPERLARIGEARLSWPVLGFAAACSLTALLIFALVPALEFARLNLVETLRATGRSWRGRLPMRAGRALVIAEITLGFVLVTGAALAARSLSRMEHVRPGFEPRQLLTFQIAFGYTLDPDVPPDMIAGWEEKLAALPGVERVGATSHLPFDDVPNWYGPYHVEGAIETPGGTPAVDYRSVTPGYFAAMDSRLIEGRFFDAQDRAGGRQVVIVDESLARTAWPGQSAVGRKIEASHVVRGSLAPVPSIVVGVVEHVRNHSLTREVRGEVYVPFEQSRRSPMTFVLRTATDPAGLVPAVRSLLHQAAPHLAIAKVHPMTDYVTREIAPAGFTAVLAAVFGALALVLAATGIYGVLHYQISRRLPEMGIRMAIGARSRDVLGMVLREGLALAAMGVLLGAVATLAAAPLLGAIVYGVSAADPFSYGMGLLLLPAAALLGCWRPARRAAGTNPAEIIREE